MKYSITIPITPENMALADLIEKYFAGVEINRNEKIVIGTDSHKTHRVICACQFDILEGIKRDFKP